MQAGAPDTAGLEEAKTLLLAGPVNNLTEPHDGFGRKSYFVVVWPGMLPVPVTPGTLPAAPGAPALAPVADTSDPLASGFVAFVVEPVPLALLPFAGKVSEGPRPSPIAGPPLPLWAVPEPPTTSPAVWA